VGDFQLTVSKRRHAAQENSDEKVRFRLDGRIDDYGSDHGGNSAGEQ
jgi:hypothetical protein